jgi:tetratricopeptide (TPR) repeat protein
VLDSLLLGLTEIKLKNVTMAEQGRAENIKRRALEDIGDGRFSEALELIVKCKELMPDDVELYSMESVALYSSGLYHKAAVAVESGLIKFNDNFDLLYNGGEIYAKLGDTGKALAMYKKALGVCSGGLSEQITEAIRKLEAD